MAKRKVSSKKVKDYDVDIDGAEDVVEAANVPFWQQPNFIFYAISAVLLLFAAYYAYNEFVKKPKQIEAEAAMWQAQMQFERDSFNLALNEPGGGYDGFLAIIDRFGGTAAGNTAHLYAGICYLNMADYDNAISYLEDYSPSDDLFATSKFMSLGDAYSEKGDLGTAIGHYASAAKSGDNELMNSYAWKKLGMLQLKEGNAAEALEAFKKVKYDYPTSPVANDIDKYIAQVGGE